MGVVLFLLRTLCLLGVIVLCLRSLLLAVSEPGSSLAQRVQSQLENGPAAGWYHQERTHEKEPSTSDLFYESVTYKLVGPYTDDIILITPGLFLNRVNASSSEAFISVVFNTQVNHYRFPVAQYKTKAQASGFTIQVGDSTFTESGMTLSLMQGEGDAAEESTIIGEIQFEEVKPWPQTMLQPGTMGFLSFFSSLMSTTQAHVLSLHHRLHGYISVGELLTDLEQGTGSIEKHRGATMPTAWVTAHANHFALLKPPKRGGAPGGAEGEVWAETEENTEETTEEGPGAGQSSGAISALYADHIHNHEQPVALYVDIARTELPTPDWLSRALGFGTGPDEDVSANPSFIPFAVGFLYEKTTHLFTSSRLDHLVRFELEVSEKDNDKEIIHMTTVSHDYTRQLYISLHKPVQINAAGRRKKDTACLKKVIAQKNREKARLGGNLNPLEEAFLLEKVKMDARSSKGSAKEEESPEVKAAMQAALDAGIALEKANTPEAKLKELYEKPIPVPAPIVSSQYAPDAATGKLVRGVRESLIGGRIELQWSELLSSAAYSQLTSKAKKAADWKQQIVGEQVMYARQIYRAIGKPATMETGGDVDSLMEDHERWNANWRKKAIEWMAQPMSGWIMMAGLIATFVLLGMIDRSSTRSTKLKAH